MASKLASELRRGDMVWLQCANGKTGARVEGVDYGELQDVAIYAGPDCARSPVVILDLRLGRGASAGIGSPILFRWSLWLEGGDRLELVDKVKGAR